MLKTYKIITIVLVALLVSALSLSAVSAQDDTDTQTTPPTEMRERENPVMEYVTSLGVTLAQLREARESGITWQEFIVGAGGDVEELRTIVLQQASERFDEMLSRPVQQPRERLEEFRSNRGEGRPQGGRGGN